VSGSGFCGYRLRLIISEMNYASRRMVELQLRLPPKVADRAATRIEKSLPASFLPAWSTAHLSLSIRPVSCLLCARKPDGNARGEPDAPVETKPLAEYRRAVK
jgi:hypothetical protein